MTSREIKLMALLFVCIVLCAFAGCTNSDAPAGPPVGANVVFLGDSITARWANLPVEGAYNYGVSGETSEQIAARMPEVIASGAHVVYILAGTNDILKLSAADVDYVQSMAEQARDAGLTVVLATIPPTSKGLGDSMARVQQFNKGVKALGFKVIDYYAALVAAYPDDTVDGIHPSEQGYLLMTQEFNRSEQM